MKIQKNFKEIKKDYQKTVQLFLTQKCNFSCDFCFRKEKGFSIGDMTLGAAKKIMDKFRSTNAKISFTGGEPTLNPAFEAMLKYCSKIGLDSEVYTNGSCHFNNYHTTVKLRYDGFDKGTKPMNSNKYRGKYDLGLLIDGTNTQQLLKCILATKNNALFEGVVQVTEVVGEKGLPKCGAKTYAQEAEFIANYIAENCDWVNKIEISVGCLSIDTGAPKCRFERYFEDKMTGTCPHNKIASECSGCLFQKQVYIRI